MVVIFKIRAIKIETQNANKPVGRGACWISRLKGELVVEGAAFELLDANLSSRFLSSLILSCPSENVGMSFFFDNADVLLVSRWPCNSSSAFWPSRSNTLHVGFGPPPVHSFSYDPSGATDLGGRPNTIPFRGLVGLALLFIFLLFGMADWVDSAHDWGTSWEFVWCPEAILPRVVVLAACYSVRHSSTALSPLIAVRAYRSNKLSSNSLMVPISWLIIPAASSSYVWWLFIWTASISFGSVTFSFLGLLGAS